MQILLLLQILLRAAANPKKVAVIWKSGQRWGSLNSLFQAVDELEGHIIAYHKTNKDYIEL